MILDSGLLLNHPVEYIDVNCSLYLLHQNLLSLEDLGLHMTFFIINGQLIENIKSLTGHHRRATKHSKKTISS